MATAHCPVQAVLDPPTLRMILHALELYLLQCSKPEPLLQHLVCSDVWHPVPAFNVCWPSGKVSVLTRVKLKLTQSKSEGAL